MSKIKWAAAAGLAAGLWAGAASAEPVIWTVRDADTTVTLYGSVHTLPGTLDWRTAAFDQALAGADEVWTEVKDAGGFSLVTGAKALIGIGRDGFLPRGERLSDLLSEEGRARLAKAAVALDLKPASLERMRPWLAMVMISAKLSEQKGHDRDLGVEAYVHSAAPKRAERLGLSEFEDEFRRLVEIPKAEQIGMLEQTLAEAENPSAGTTADLVAAWRAGDLAALQKLSVDEMRDEFPETYRLLIRERNQLWAARIEEMLETPGRKLVVAGAGHYLGPDGLPALLCARGLKVEGAGGCS